MKIIMICPSCNKSIKNQTDIEIINNTFYCKSCGQIIPNFNKKKFEDLGIFNGNKSLIKEKQTNYDFDSNPFGNNQPVTENINNPKFNVLENLKSKVYCFYGIKFPYSKESEFLNELYNYAYNYVHLYFFKTSNYNVEFNVEAKELINNFCKANNKSNLINDIENKLNTMDIFDLRDYIFIKLLGKFRVYLERETSPFISINNEKDIYQYFTTEDLERKQFLIEKKLRNCFEILGVNDKDNFVKKIWENTGFILDSQDGFKVLGVDDINNPQSFYKQFLIDQNTFSKKYEIIFTYGLCNKNETIIDKIKRINIDSLDEDIAKFINIDKININNFFRLLAFYSTKSKKIELPTGDIICADPGKFDELCFDVRDEIYQQTSNKKLLLKLLIFSTQKNVFLEENSYFDFMNQKLSINNSDFNNIVIFWANNYESMKKRIDKKVSINKEWITISDFSNLIFNEGKENIYSAIKMIDEFMKDPYGYAQLCSSMGINMEEIDNEIKILEV